MTRLDRSRLRPAPKSFRRGRTVRLITDMVLVFTAVVRLGLGLLFLISGGSKFLRARSVERMVANYRLVPRSLLPIVKLMLAPAEVAAGVLLLLSLWLPVYAIAWVLAFGLILVFTAGVASALLRGLEIPCGCGLLLNGHVITHATLVRNLALLSLLALDLLVQRTLLP